MGQVAAEKSQAPQTEPAVKDGVYGGEDTHAADTQRMRPAAKQSGDSESGTSCLFPRGWGFKVSEESSSPSLGLVRLKKARMSD